MGSTFLSLHYHLVFATKERQPLIESSWMPRLHEYMGGIINALNGQSLGVGGVEDHVHLLVRLKATHCLADLMRELKRGSSFWIHESIGKQNFAWQEGYSAFTVSPNSISGVVNYIRNQEQHHRQRDFESELKMLLKAAQIEYDERYLI